MKSQQRWLAAGLIWLAFALMVSSALQKSATVDEQSHLFRGVAYLQEGATHFLLGHPLGASGLAALPLLTVPELNLPLDTPAWEAGDWSVAGDLFMWQLNENPQQLLFLGRMPVMWLTVLLLALVFRWGRELAGGKAALLALILLAFDPNLLANGRIISGDLPLTLFFVLAVYGFWRWVVSPGGWQGMLLAGLGLGLASASKFNAALLLPILGLLGLFVAWWRRSWQPLLVLLGVGAVGSLVIWGVNGFALRPYPGGPFWDDLFWELQYFGKPHGAYLAGNYSTKGWWYYFPFAFAIKTPLLTLLLLVMAFVAPLFFRRKWGKSRTHKVLEKAQRFTNMQHNNLFLLLPVAVYFGVSLTSSLNIGYRYLLPTLPFLWLFTAVSLKNVLLKWPRLARLGLAAVAVWQVSLALFIWPDYIPFFNVLAGGPDESWRLLSDSNIDWGQDLPALTAWQQENDQPVKLSYFGTAHPSAYGVDFEPLPMWPPAPEQALPNRQLYDPLNPAPGVYALSVTSLHGVVLGTQRNAFAAFREKEPFVRLGSSLFLYEVPATGPPVDLVLLGVEPANLSSPIRAELASNDLRVRWLDNSSVMLWPAKGGWLILGEGEMLDEAIQALLNAELVVESNGQRLYRLHEASLPQAEPYSFAGQLSLLDVDFLPGASNVEPIVTLATMWEVFSPSENPLKIFVHALDEEGQLLSQWDGLAIAPDSWRTGDQFMQLHALSLPGEERPSQFLIGIYDGETLERMGEPINVPAPQRNETLVKRP